MFHSAKIASAKVRYAKVGVGKFQFAKLKQLKKIQLRKLSELFLAVAADQESIRLAALDELTRFKSYILSESAVNLSCCMKKRSRPIWSLLAQLATFDYERRSLNEVIRIELLLANLSRELQLRKCRGVSRRLRRLDLERVRLNASIIQKSKVREAESRVSALLMKLEQNIDTTRETALSHVASGDFPQVREAAARFCFEHFAVLFANEEFVPLLIAAAGIIPAENRKRDEGMWILALLLQALEHFSCISIATRAQLVDICQKLAQNHADRELCEGVMTLT